MWKGCTVCALIDHTMNMRQQCIAAAEKGKSMFWGINKNREFWKFPFLEIVHLCLCQAQKSRMTMVILPSWVIYYFHTSRPNLEKLNHCTTCIYHILWELLGRNCLHALSLTQIIRTELSLIVSLPPGNPSYYNPSQLL